MQLYEKYRPKTWSEFVGQDKIVTQLKALMGRPSFDRDAFWFSGLSGVGKSSAAWICARQLVNDDFDIIEYNGEDINKGAVQDIRSNIWLCPIFGDWKCYIINEAHNMSKHAVQCWLTILEELPPKRLIIFTTTEDIKADLFGDFSSPFARRCKVFAFTTQGLARSFAVKAREIACKEGLSGKGEQAYYRLVQRCNNNMGMVLSEIDKGEMLK